MFMSNEFEKQVQQKMEELKLVPSEPVWQKVEMQIRKKKDRRRLIFWIPFLVLLLGGGLWTVINHYSNQASYNKGNNVAEKNKSADQNSITTSTKTTDKKTEDQANTITNNDRPQNENANEVTKTNNINIGLG